MLQINTNVPAMTALRTLTHTSGQQDRTIERLSTGYRINRASDDPSGLVISEKLRSQINGLGQALENTQNDINLINTAEAALAEINDILVDIRASIIFAMNSGFSIPEQIDAEQDKIDQSLVAIDRIAQATRFAKRNLLNGDSDFIIEQNAVDRSAAAEIQVRSVRLSPTAAAQNFSVNVTKLAERATLIFNKDFDSTDAMTSLSPGGTESDFVTMRVTGSRGTEDLNFGNTANVQDLVNAINQNATSTGVYASSYRPLPMDAEIHEVEFAGTQGTTPGFTVEPGTSVVLGVNVEGASSVQNVVLTDSDLDGIIGQTEIQTVFDNTFPPPGSVFTIDTVGGATGNLRIIADGSDFTLQGGANVKSVRITAQELEDNISDGGDGEYAFDIDIDGDGTADINLTTASGATMSGGINSAAERQAIMTALQPALSGISANLGAYFETTTGDLVIFDTGDNLGQSTAQAGILAANDSSAAMIKDVDLAGNFTGGLEKLSLDEDGVPARDRGVEFVNIDISNSIIDSDGNLAINPGAFNTTTDFQFDLYDPESQTLVNVVAAPGADGVVDEDEIATAIQTAVGAAGGTAADWDAFFSRENGLTIVYKNRVSDSGRFRVQNSSTAADNDFQLVAGVGSIQSNENSERLALYSIDFGAENVISLEDVTNSTSTLSFRSVGNNGLTVTRDGREGLGLFAGEVNTLRTLNGGSISSAGVDVEGSVNGLAFRGQGFNVQLVTTAIDVRMNLVESWGRSGSVGERADAVAFGLADRIGGFSLKTRLANENALPPNVLDSFEFTVRQNFEGGPRGQSGLRFQIRETNSQQDSLNVGIRSVTIGNLGLDIAAESDDANSAQRTNTFNGGKLNSLRTGNGNDLFSNPENALEILDAAIDQVTDTRAFLGSISKDTLQRNLNSAAVALENLTASEGAIRNIDFAKETTEMARLNVLYAAGVSVLAQANQGPQQLIQLLQ